MAPRHYFYHLSHQGWLHLESTATKNFITALKEPKFLNFFFENLRWRPETKKYDIISEPSTYPICSVCQGELNWVSKDEDFGCMTFKTLDKGKDGTPSLIYGADLEEPFDPNELVLRNGWLYHRVRKHKYLKGGFGLVPSKVAEELTSTSASSVGDVMVDEEMNIGLIRYEGKETHIKVIEE
jgi:hypothetical protein